MEKSMITNQEYDRLTRQLNFYDTTRNHLLIFSFTTVLAIIGSALAIDTDKTSAWIYLVPYLLIISFAARVAYYRLASAHVNSFLKKFALERMLFSKGTEIVKEGHCKRFGMIAWLINHEMVMLGGIVTIIFYFKYFGSQKQPIISPCPYWDYLALFLPIFLLYIVYIISDSTYDYKELMDGFTNDWCNYTPLIEKIKPIKYQYVFQNSAKNKARKVYRLKVIRNHRDKRDHKNYQFGRE